MKVKIYPLNNYITELEATASPFCVHLQIICASLSNGTSIIKNVVDSEDVDTTIQWCKAIGANIKKNNGKLLIKGTNNELNYKSSLFVCETSTTAKLMIPLLCSVSQPFGVKTNKSVIKELTIYKKFIEAFGVNFYIENEMIRFEKILTPQNIELDGDIDICFVAGLFLALPRLKGQSIVKLRAPVRSELSYSTILKVLKSFSVDIKHPATMRYEINGGQHYKKATVTPEIDKFLLSHLSLLTQKTQENSSIKVNKYKMNARGDESLLFDVIKKNAINYNYYFPFAFVKKRTFDFHKLETGAENSLPLLMVLASLNNKETIITRVNFMKERVKKQYNIMSKIFTKLSISNSSFESEIVINPSVVKEKKQVDCDSDPYVAMAISILAVLSEAPIVIKNAQCVYSINRDFYKMLSKFGVLIDFIYD